MVNEIKENTWTVYRHISPSGKVYIGITSQDVLTRWHYGHGYVRCEYFYKAIQKYGWNSIKHEVLFTNLSEEKAKYLEVELIRHYKALGISYNLTDGGDGWLGYHHSDETKEKMRVAKLGTHLSEDTKQKMSKSRMGRLGTMNGKRHTEETKAKMSVARTGKKKVYKKTKEEITKNAIEVRNAFIKISVLWLRQKSYLIIQNKRILTPIISDSLDMKRVAVLSFFIVIVLIFNCPPHMVFLFISVIILYHIIQEMSSTFQEKTST